jgi:hypothetical protein
MIRVKYETRPDSDCWYFSGSKDSGGYGNIRKRVNGRNLYLGAAHRVAYQQAVGPIPVGMEVDHICFTPSCVNPDHLRLLTPDENRRRQRSALKSACVNGHEFTDANTYRRPTGQRDCRACIRHRVATYKERRAAA